MKEEMETRELRREVNFELKGQETSQITPYSLNSALTRMFKAVSEDHCTTYCSS